MMLHCLKCYRQYYLSRIHTKLHAPAFFSSSTLSVSTTAMPTTTKKPPYKILFFGTDWFSLAVFKPFFKAIQTLPIIDKSTNNTLVARLEVACLPQKLFHDQSARRPSHREPLRQYCHLHRVPVIDYVDYRRGAAASPPQQNSNSSSTTAEMQLQQPTLVPNIERGEFDVAIVASFGRLIPSTIIEKFEFGIINVHPSLLPKYRGSTPLQRTLLNNDAVAGVTLSLIEPHQFDVGKIIDQRSYDLVASDSAKLTCHQLGARLARLGSDMLLNMLSSDLPAALRAAWPQPPVPSHLRRSYQARKLLENGSEMLLQWQSAVEVERQYRALFESAPLRTWWNGEVVKISKISLLDFEIDSLLENSSDMRAGSLFFHKKRKVLCVLCADGQWVTVGRIVLKGKHPMTPAEFYNGCLSKDGKYDQYFATTAAERDTTAERGLDEKEQKIVAA